MSVYHFDDYRLYVESRIQGDWGAVTRLAKAANCQRSYFSRAVKGEVLLTPDHLDGLCSYWKLSEEEAEFLMLLLEKARAGSLSYRTRIERKLKRLRLEQENIGRRVKAPQLNASDQELLYYSSWHWAAIHICTSIPSMQTESAIAESLRLPIGLVQRYLLQLAAWGLVKKSGKHWSFVSGNIHLPKTSPMIGLHHGQWRQKAVDDSLLAENEGLHYTSVQAMNESAFLEIKTLLLKAIEDSLKIADPAKEEAIVIVNMDAFRLN